MTKFSNYFKCIFLFSETLTVSTNAPEPPSAVYDISEDDDFVFEPTPRMRGTVTDGGHIKKV